MSPEPAPQPPAWAVATATRTPGRVAPGTQVRNAVPEVWGADVAAPSTATPFRLNELPGAAPAVDERARVAGYAAGWAAGARAAAEAAQADRSRLGQERDRAEQHRARVFEESLAVLRSVADAVRAREGLVLAEARGAVHRAALELAEAVLGVELSDAPHAARAALARALTFDVAQGPFVVRLHPQDLEALRAEDAPALPDGVELRGDPAVARGDAIAERSGSTLDAGIAGALARARAALLGDGTALDADVTTADGRSGGAP